MGQVYHAVSKVLAKRKLGSGFLLNALLVGLLVAPQAGAVCSKSKSFNSLADQANVVLYDCKQHSFPAIAFPKNYLNNNQIFPVQTVDAYGKVLLLKGVGDGYITNHSYNDWPHATGPQVQATPPGFMNVNGSDNFALQGIPVPLPVAAWGFMAALLGVFAISKHKHLKA